MVLSPLITSHESFEWIKKNNTLLDYSINLIGFPFDGTASYKKGTRFGPDSIRNVACALESYSPFFDQDILNVRCFDLGNLAVGTKQTSKDYLETSNTLKTILNHSLAMKNVKFVIMGGEHSISYTPISCMLKKYPNLVLLHLDAHADLRQDYEGNIYSHASVIRRVWEEFGPKHKLIQFGIRSGTQEEFQLIKEKKWLIKKAPLFFETLKKLPAKTPIYLTLDLDFFDPSVLPGTGTPEPGGYDYPVFEKILSILKTKHLVGADVVELSPPEDPSHISSIFAAKIIREIILCLAGKEELG
ncbi:MAG: agmatinase [Bdellovibrionales bacterium RIFOXYB1_FULL_37_110]|nr:MAG: agmatinase [Bdellovibrionales bacterium RIFOXYC1_FULL_37_79]OFZ58621.1 MAG: agmatinase [Bdellovibrionales bacterium RIFOXYB1_FULL_37_110]OFZ61717.1 MAG: agmatinase [Bdellovibrionales bacterium RIFOXYD1_FULL_36_51]